MNYRRISLNKIVAFSIYGSVINDMILYVRTWRRMVIANELDVHIRTKTNRISRTDVDTNRYRHNRQTTRKLSHHQMVIVAIRQLQQSNDHVTLTKTIRRMTMPWKRLVTSKSNIRRN